MSCAHRFVFILMLLLCLSAAGCDNAAAPSNTGVDKPLEVAGPTMGTRYSIKLYGVPDGVNAAMLQTGIEATLAEINDAMSTWQEDSELSRFNQSDSTEWFDVSAETVEVVRAALVIHRETDGAFDATVNPLLKLWGFGPYDRPETVPTADEIEAVRQDVGSDLIEVRLERPALRKQRPGVQIDLSAIAKGYAVDQVSEWIAEQGVEAALVEIGGEVRAFGAKPDGTRWMIGIEKPTPEERSVQRAIPLGEMALATSGDYRNYYEKDGRRFSHTIDPRTGRPIEHQLAAVSVLADDCMTADALATGMMVLGPDDAYALAVERGWAAYFIVRDGDRFIERETPRFTELTGQQDVRK